MGVRKDHRHRYNRGEIKSASGAASPRTVPTPFLRPPIVQRKHRDDSTRSAHGSLLDNGESQVSSDGDSLRFDYRVARALAAGTPVVTPLDLVGDHVTKSYPHGSDERVDLQNSDDAPSSTTPRDVTHRRKVDVGGVTPLQQKLEVRLSGIEMLMGSISSEMCAMREAIEALTHEVVKLGSWKTQTERSRERCATAPIASVDRYDLVHGENVQQRAQGNMFAESFAEEQAERMDRRVTRIERITQNQLNDVRQLAKEAVTVAARQAVHAELEHRRHLVEKEEHMKQTNLLLQQTTSPRVYRSTSPTSDSESAHNHFRPSSRRLHAARGGGSPRVESTHEGTHSSIHNSTNGSSVKRPSVQRRPSSASARIADQTSSTAYTNTNGADSNVYRSSKNSRPISSSGTHVVRYSHIESEGKGNLAPEMLERPMPLAKTAPPSRGKPLIRRAQYP